MSTEEVKMILADKIIAERKKLGLSQEDLAEKLSVSRQSVSKWEGAQAVPDLQKIIKLSEIFNVSTDYLLKDEMCSDYSGSEPAGNRGVTETVTPVVKKKVRKLSMDEAVEYLDTVKENAPKLGFGVLLAVNTPVVMLFMIGLMVDGYLGTGISVATGVTSILLITAFSVFYMIVYGNRIDRFDYLKKEPFEPEADVVSMVEARIKKHEETYSKLIVIAILLCILCPVPLIITAVMEMANGVILFMVSVLLMIVSLAVYIFVTVGCMEDSFKILIKPKQKTL